MTVNASGSQRDNPKLEEKATRVHIGKTRIRAVECSINMEALTRLASAAPQPTAVQLRPFAEK
jgi:hypothetical protein